MARPTPDALAACRGRPLALQERLGNAHPWLCPGAAPIPWLPDTPGTALLLNANVGARALPALPAGFVLPVRWRRDLAAHSPRLPRGLGAVADEVRALSRDPLRPDDRWHLDLSEALADVDLSALEMEGRSGMAPLLAALVVAQYGGTPGATAFATGAWSSETSRYDDVGGIVPKLVAVAGLGLPSARVFVPEGNLAEATAVAPSLPGVTIEALARPRDSARTTAIQQLDPLLAVLESEPQTTDLTTLLAWGNRDDVQLRRDRGAYFRRRLATPLADEATIVHLEHARERTERAADSALRGGRLALIANPRPDVSAVLCRALRPREVLFLWHGVGDDRRGLDAHARELARSLDLPAPTLEPFAPAAAGRNVEAIAAWLREGDGPAVAECTNGLGPMRLVLGLAAMQARATLVHLRQGQFDATKPVPYVPATIEVHDWIHDAGLSPR